MLRALIVFSVIIIYSVTPIITYAKKNDTLRMLDLFGDVFEKVKSDYVEDVKDKDLLESAINGMLTSLDPHSSYLNEKAFNEMRIQTRGEFGGLGIEVTMENGLVKVVSPIDDTPAYEAGIMSGDYISRIDDDPVMGLTLSEAVEKMRGRPRTKIKLTILREGESEPLEFTITRAIIKIESVKSKKFEDVGYLRVTAFSENTASNLKKEIKKVRSDLGKKYKGTILDLRNNPGGLLDQAIEVTDLFLSKGEIVSTKGRVADSNKRFNASKGDLTDNKPLVVLINGGSASASEIVSGALQDHKRAVIIGTKSFGKGSVQTIIPLSASNGAMRLTTSRYYTPSGRSIQAEGIEPDIVIEQAKLEALSKNALQTRESNLRRHLTNAKKEANQRNKKASDLSELYEKDYQLGRAIDLLRGIAIYGNGTPK